MRGLRLVAAMLTVVLACGAGVALGEQSSNTPQPPIPAGDLSSPPSQTPGVELTSKRTASSETFRLPGGALQTRIYESPIHYRAPDGLWRPIDDDFEETASGGLTNGDNRFDVSLPERLGDAPVRFDAGGHWVAYELLGATSDSAELDGQTALYEVGDRGPVFEFSNLPNGLKEEIVLEDPSQPSTFAFELTSSSALTPSLTEDGAVEFRDQVNALVAQLPAPVISDSAPAALPSHDIGYRLEPDAEGGWRLNLEVDREWLLQPNRVWPVHIDPTLTVGPSPECQFHGSPGTGGGHACASEGWKVINTRAIYSQTAPDWYARTGLKFDTSSIPSSAYVTEAKVGLHTIANALNTSGVSIARSTKSWTGGISWKTYNGTTAWTQEGGDFTEGKTILTANRGAQAGWWVFADRASDFLTGGMTDIVQKWVSGTYSNQGLIVRLRDDTTKDCSLASCNERRIPWDSSVATEQSIRPYMEVTYYPKAPVTSKITLPLEGTKTARRLKLQSSLAPGTTAITYQYETGGIFKTIPPSLITTADGNPVSWPFLVKGSLSEPLYFDTAGLSSYKEGGGALHLRALFDGLGVSGYSPTVKATVDRFIGGTGDATTQVGPGTVNLLTGNFTVARTDVSISSWNSALEFSRTYNSRDPNNSANTGVLGAGWTPSAPVEAAGGAEWQKVTEVIPSAEEKEEGANDYALVKDLEGYEYAFELVGGTYVSPPEAPEWILSRLSATELALTDSDGNRTVFGKVDASNEYFPKSITQAEANGTKMVYETPAGQKPRLTMVIAPAAPGISCDSTNAKATPGCRSLAFTYEAATKWGAPSNYGVRLSAITFYGPLNATINSQWQVAKYTYNAQGRLVAESDPRVSPELPETYTYSNNQIATITPPGEEPWSFDYTASEEAQNGRLVRVKRPSLLASPSLAETTIVYGVPLSGSGAPYDMSKAAVAQWGQQDLPTDATAIFPPDQVPSSPPSTYSRATVYYVDADGRAVNTATPAGAGTSAPSIMTAETDEHGNVVRELTAQNRLRALAEGAKSISRSHELETKRTYSVDGTEMQEEWGPLHEVRLESGSLVQARRHTAIQYDEEAPKPPSGTPWPHLPTKETTGASIPGQGIDADQRTTQRTYRWDLRKPVSVIVDPEGLALRTRTEWGLTLPVRTSLPSDPYGLKAASTDTIYYEAGSVPHDPQCGGKPGWANLPCIVRPIVDPSTPGLPRLPWKEVTRYSYLGQPLEIKEFPAGETENTRTSEIKYTADGKVRWQFVGGKGVDAPTIETIYSPTTGREIERRALCGFECPDRAVTTTYDTLGRPVAYEDGDGSVSSATYDLLGRPVTTSDGKGIQTRTYDPTSGLLVQLNDSGAGLFSAKYDADGQMTEKTLPNGLIARTTYDETGAPVHLLYEKATGCSVECTWLDFDVEESIHGQWLRQAGTLSTQDYSYDKAGRLREVKDTPKGGGCTTRSYSYDANSNRTALTTRQPGVGGICTSSGGATQTYTYDDGDRLIGSGIAYDVYGRITSLSSAYAGGSTLTTTYFENDLVASQSQGGVTNTYQLDAAMRQRQRVQTGGSSPGTEIYHYAGPSDSPAWIDNGSSWTRNVVGIGGELAAIQKSSGTTTLQLANLHGDIVATASVDPEATKLLSTFEFDEFGNPKGGGHAKYGWLGGHQRRTELPSGVIQMGVRSYIPAMGRFISVDPVKGGSANAYDYVNADPVGQVDFTGTRTEKRIHCDFGFDDPHRSKHRNYKRVNAVLTGGCFGGEVTQATARLRLAMYRNGQKVAVTPVLTRKISVHPSPIRTSGIKVPFVNSPECQTGWYQALALIVIYSPAGYEPPADTAKRLSRKVFIRC